MPENEFETLSIDPDGNDYVLKRDEGNGKITSLRLSEVNVVFLGRLAPTVAKRIVASKSLAGGDVSASVAAPIKSAAVNTDLHGDLILLRVIDEFDGEFDFSCSPDWAANFGTALIKWAEKANATPKPMKQ